MDYEKYSTGDFCRELTQALGLRRVGNSCSASALLDAPPLAEQEVAEALEASVQSFNKRKGYVITKDNYIKIMQIVQKSVVKIPFVICGDTGCGKTHMVNFISSCLLGDEFRCFTLHAGVTVEQFVRKMVQYFELARDLATSGEKNNMLKPRQLWILVDEFNTSYLQPLLAELINQRTCSFDERIDSVPENVIFVGCFNPFMIPDGAEQHQAKDEEIGFAVKDSSAILSHKVFPVCDSLLSFLIDFGQLKPEDEEKYIEEMIKGWLEERTKKGTQVRFSLEKYTQKLILMLIVACQRETRALESHSAASLRDVDRFLAVFEFFEGWEELNLEEVAAMTCNITYLLRVRNPEDKSKIIANLKSTIKKTHYKELAKLKLDISSDFERVSKAVSEQALSYYGSEGNDISLNQPIVENLIAILTGITLKLNVMICGRPGTSKTLAVQIAEKVLKPSSSEEIRG